MKKRILAVLLILAWAVSALPMTALAQERAEAAPGTIGVDTPELAPEPADAAPAIAGEPAQAEPAQLLAAGPTRGEWVHELVELFGVAITPEEYVDVYFPDIEDHTYFADIMAAVGCGMVAVEAGDDFRPDDPLTQEFAVQTLNAQLGLQPADQSGELYAQVAVERGWFGGSYAAATAVTQSQATAMLADARTTLESRRVDQPVSNYTFAGYVKVVPDSAQVTMPELGIVRIEGFDGVAQGDVFAFYDQGVAYVYTAETVALQADGLLIVTADAPEGAVLSAEFAGELTPELTFIPDETPVTLMSADGPVTFGAARAVEVGKNSIKISRSITLADGVKGSLNVDIKNLKPSGSLGSRKFILLEGTVDVSSTVKFDLLNDPAAAALSLGGVSLGPMGYVGVEINLQMEAKLSYTYSADFGLGAEYWGGKMHNISYCRNKGSTLSAEGKASAMLSLAAWVDLGVVGNASARISAGPVIKVQMKKYSDGAPQTCVTLSGYLEVGAFVSAKVGSYKYSNSWYLFNEKNSPIRVYEHIEDGVTVGACSRGKTAQGSKYISPSSSRIYSSGNRNASSTGYGGSGGTAAPVVIWTTSDNDDGTVTLTGYQGNASVLSIPETIDGKTVTKIGSSAFANNKTIRVVTIPDSVVIIGKYAFEGCENLSTVDFGENVTDIAPYAFYRCASLVEVNLPEGLRELGNPKGGGYIGGVFSDCLALKRVYIPTTLEDGRYNFKNCPKLDQVIFGEGISMITEGLFGDCTGLTHIEIPNTVTTIGSSAFQGCTNLATVKMPESVTNIGSSAFRDCTNLAMVKIPDSVTTIDAYAFQDCRKLATVAFGENLNEIGWSAFQGCTALTRAELPEGLTGLGVNLFYKCTALNYVYIPGTLERSVHPSAWTNYGFFGECPSLNTIVFSNDISSIFDGLFRNSSITHIEIPDTVATIGSSAFQGCKNLPVIEIPESVTSIGSSAFQGCTNLAAVKIPDSVTAIGAYAFQDCTKLVTVTFSENLTEIGWSAFQGCTALIQAELPEGLTGLGVNLFYKCTALNYVYVPGTLERSVHPSAWTNYGFFGECPSLNTIVFGKDISTILDGLFFNSSITRIEIPDTVTTYKGAVFQNCTKLVSVKLSKNVLDIPRSMFSGCASLKTVEMPEGVTEIPYGAFSGCAALTDLSLLPESVTAIDNYAFQNCTGLVSVDLPDLVSTLGGSAFQGCTSLTSFKSGNDLLTIGSNCFQDCGKLTQVELNDGLTSIGSYAFQNCATLAEIDLPDSVSKLGDYIFQKNPKLTRVKLPAGLKAVPSYAFANCTAMTELDIPKGATKIGNNAFYQDTKLKTFTIPASVTSIGDNAFSYATTTAVKGVKGSYAESYAKWKTFTDVTKPATGLTLAGGKNAMTIDYYGDSVAPRFAFAPADSTDVVVSMVSDDTNVVRVRDDLTLDGYRRGTANVTATTLGGLRYTFAVTVDDLDSIEVTQKPTKLEYGVKDDKDLTGMVVNAVFKNGNRERVYDYTVSGFNTDTVGVKTVTVTYQRKTAAFDIEVSKVVTGNLGSRQELTYQYNVGAGTVKVTGAMEAGARVLVGGYGAGDQLLSGAVVQTSGGAGAVRDGTKTVKLFYLDERLRPLCECVVVPVK